MFLFQLLLEQGEMEAVEVLPAAVQTLHSSTEEAMGSDRCRWIPPQISASLLIFFHCQIFLSAAGGSELETQFAVNPGSRWLTCDSVSCAAPERRLIASISLLRVTWDPLVFDGFHQTRRRE